MAYRKETKDPDAPPTPRECKAMMEDAIKRQNLIQENLRVYQTQVKRRIGRKFFAWTDYFKENQNEGAA